MPAGKAHGKVGHPAAGCQTLLTVTWPDGVNACAPDPLEREPVCTIEGAGCAVTRMTDYSQAVVMTGGNVGSADDVLNVAGQTSVGDAEAD
jgi:hypothetical protein